MTYAQQLAVLQNAMIAGVCAPMLPLIKPARHNEFPPEARLSVYTDGYEARLFDALRVDFPALEHYLGEEPFAASLYAYLRAHPSVFWDLNLYSLPYAAFVRGYFDDPAAVALAALETAIVEVFWLPESEAWRPSAETSPEVLMEQNLPLRAASKLLSLSHPVEEYLAAFRREKPIDMPAAAENWMLLVRHENEVRRYMLSTAEHKALTFLQQGRTLAEALAAAPDIETAQGWFARWIAEGVLQG